jgi:hypothetical protein
VATPILAARSLAAGSGRPNLARGGLLHALALSAALALVACSSSGKLEMARSPSEAIPTGKSVALWVRPTLPDDRSKQARQAASEAADRLKSELFGRLVSEGIFNSVFQPGEPADYHLDVSVTQAKEVSQTRRFWLGTLAGRNQLTAAVALYDEQTGKLLTDFRVSGESAAVPASSRSDLEDAVHEAADRILLALKTES